MKKKETLIDNCYPEMDVNNSFLKSHIIVNKPFKVYWFQISQYSNSWKIGETSRDAFVRKQEWEIHYPDLYNFDYIEMEYKGKILCDDEVRRILKDIELESGFSAVKIDELKGLGLYGSDEFVKSSVINTPEKMRKLMEKIYNNFVKQIDTGVGTYHILNREDRSVSSSNEYIGNEDYKPLPHQERAIEKYLELANSSNTFREYLMKICTRGGKTFTALECAVANNDTSICILSSFTNVENEWKKQLLTHEHTNKTYAWITDDNIMDKENIKLIKQVMNPNYKGDKGFVYFTTVQNFLENSDWKKKHNIFKNRTFDLVIADEVHHGIKSNKHYSVLNGKLRFKNLIGLSGTPYRLMLSNAIPQENVIIDYTIEDMYTDKANWNKENPNKENFYSFLPDCITFATKPPKTCLDKITFGETDFFSDLFRVNSVKGRFYLEPQVLDWLFVLDGTKEDLESFSVFGNPVLLSTLKSKHAIVFLQTKAAVTALIKLINDNAKKFKHLKNYLLLAATGEDEKDSEQIKDTIASVENQIRENKEVVVGDKAFNKGVCEGTITFTVNKMGTGATVREWNIGIYLKDGHSAQVYDQNRGRLLTPYYDEYEVTRKGKKEKIKICRKEQVYFFDYFPDRALDVVNDNVMCKIFNRKNSKKSYNETLEETLSYMHLIFNDGGKLYEHNVNTFTKEFRASLLRKGLRTANSYISIDDDCFNNILSVNEDFVNCLNTIKLDKEDSDLTYKALTPKDKDAPPTYRNAKEEVVTIPKDIAKSKSPKQAEEPQDDREKQLLLARKKYKAIVKGLIKYAYFTKSSVKTIDELINSIVTSKRNKEILKNLDLDLNLETIHTLNNILERNYAYSMIENIDVNLQRAQSIRDLHNENDNKIEACKEFINWYGQEINESTFVTPNDICNLQVNLVLGKNKCIKNKKVFVFDTSGEYLLTFLEKGVSLDKNSFITIPKARPCIEILRRVCNLLGISSKGIASFTWKDVLDEFVDINDFIESFSKFYTRKSFSKVTLNDIKNYKGIRKMKFDVVIGNPPYQVSDGGFGSSASTIYTKFVDFAKKLDPAFMSMIIPARWYTCGKGTSDFRNEMLNDTHITQLYDYPNPKDIFKSGFVVGGVCVFLRDKNKEGKCKIHTINNGIETAVSNRYLKDGDLDIFVRYERLLSILNKVIHKMTESFSSIVSSRKPYGLATDATVNPSKYRLPEFLDTPEKNGFNLFGLGEHRDRCVRYLSADYPIPVLDKFLYKDKIFIAKNNGSPVIGGAPSTSVITEIILCGPRDLCTDTYIQVGLSTEEEKLNCEKYIKSKFFRCLMAIMKQSQSICVDTFRFVPLQDFTSNSDIDWSKSIH